MIKKTIMKQEFWVELGDFLGSAIDGSMIMAGIIPNILVSLALTVIFIKCLGILKSEKYEEA